MAEPAAAPENNRPAAVSSAAPESTWLGEAAQLANADPLIEAFSILTGRLHQPVSVQQLKSGLPTGKGKVTPTALVEAAEYAGFDVRILRVPLEKIGASTVPCILILKGDRAAVLVAKKGDKYEVVYPEIPGESQIKSEKALTSEYAGFAIFARAATLKRRVKADESSEHARQGWFWSAILKNRRVYRDVMLAAIMVNLFAVASPLFVMNVYDRVVPNKAIETLWVLAIGALIVYVFDFFLRGLRAYFVDAAGRDADRLMSGRLFRHLMSMRLDSGRVSAGALADELKQFESLREFFTSATLTALVDLPFILIFLVIIWLIGGWLVIVPLVTVPLALAVCWMIQKPMNELVKEGMKERAYKNSLLVEAIAGLETIKTQSAEAEMMSQWSQLVEVGGRNWVKSRALSTFALNFSAWVSQISSIFMVILGVYLISDQLMTMGALVAAVMLLGRIMAPLATIANLLTRMNQSMEARNLLDQFMQREPERVPGRSYLERTTLRGDYRLEGASFKYPEQGPWALEKLNLHITAGEKVGIIGGMGSGKSTLIRLMAGLYLPTEGSLQIDGHELAQLDPVELRSKIGFCEQSPFLFAGTIRDNIALGHREVDDSAVIRAARIAGVTEFTSSTKAGLDQPCGERGVLLSGGQRQAVALARAFLFDPPVLLMDEPTGAMDRAFEARFIDRMSSVIKDKTVIIVTHRQAMLALCNRLIIMDQGVILADGPKDDVVNALKQGKIRRTKGTSSAGNLGGLT